MSPIDPAAEPDESAVYTQSFTVAESDIDELGHANNLVYLRWVQEAFIAHSAAVGLGFEDYRRIGGVFYVRRHDIEYLRPVLRGEPVQVRTWIGTTTAASSERLTEIRNGSGALAARVTTTFAYVDIATGRPARIPAEVRAAFRMAPRSVPPKG